MDSSRHAQNDQHHIHESISNRRRILSAVASASGNLVEWFDFFAYAFTALYFSAAFFPSHDRTTQLLGSSGVLAVGFFLRPLGAWFFGRLADRRGRRLAMLWCVTLMAAGSMMIAALPTYASIGVAAPALLLLARLLQGFSVGGEYACGATYMSEVSTRGRRGFFASFQMFTIVAGQLLALLVVAALQRLLSDDELCAWGWRVPFLIGGLAGLISVWLRRSLVETASDEAMAASRATGALRQLRSHRRAILLVGVLSACGAMYFNLFTSYMQKYLVNTAGMDIKTASDVLAAALFLYMLLQPLTGALSDRIGQRSSVRCFLTLGLLATLPLLRALGQVTSPTAAFALILSALAIHSFSSSIGGLLFADLFPASVRALGVGLPFAVASALFGGTTEYVALWLKAAGHEGWFALYATALLGVGVLASLGLPDTRKVSYLDGTDPGREGPRPDGGPAWNPGAVP